MQEHPEKYTDEQIAALLADDEVAEYLQQLAMTKQAFTKEETSHEDVPVDEMWQQFAADHADELDALNSPSSQTGMGRTFQWSVLRKIAAVFLGVVATVGLTFAAFSILRSNDKTPDNTTATTNTATVTSRPVQPMPQDTAVASGPVIFDNVSLDRIAQTIAAFHHVGIDVQNKQAGTLRFYFVWRQTDSLKTVVDQLNQFGKVDILMQNDKLIVR